MLRLTPPVDHTLERLFPYGVAFHHAGLTAEERSAVASAFDPGVLKVLVATCGLAASLNLPARRVIVKGARLGRGTIGASLLRQMRGRAGRKGRDEVGETYVLCGKDELNEVRALLVTETPPVVSGLTPERRGLRRALLEAVTTRIATKGWAVRAYARKTLLACVLEAEKLEEMVKADLAALVADGLLYHVDSAGSGSNMAGRSAACDGAVGIRLAVLGDDALEHRRPSSHIGDGPTSYPGLPRSRT